MKIEINFSDYKDALIFKHDIPEGISINWPPLTIRQEFGNIQPITIIISFSIAVSSKVLGNWIYDKIKNHGSNKITIDRKKIILDKGEITRIIQEKIEQK